MRAGLVAAVIVASAVLAWTALAGRTGDFIGPGTYATAEDCLKVAALAHGTPRNVDTVPETLTKVGFVGWEGSCTFREVTPLDQGPTQTTETQTSKVQTTKTWKAMMDCQEGASEGSQSNVFERLPDGALKVTVMGNDTIFVRCDKDEGK